MNEKVKFICDKVRNFCREMIEGNVSDDLIILYGVSKDYLDICRDKSHYSCNKLKDRLFHHIMNMIGYYSCMSDEIKIKELVDSIDERLMNPSAPTDVRILSLPKMIYGVKNVIQRICEISETDKIDFNDKNKLSSLDVLKMPHAFQVNYQRNPYDNISLEDYSLETKIILGSESIIVPPDGKNVVSHQVNFTGKDKLSLQISSFKTDSLDGKSPYYFRYITEVKTIPHILGVFDCRRMDIDGIDIDVIDCNVDNQDLYVYFVGYDSRKYLVIDYDKPLSVKNMQELSFSVIVTLGMLTSEVHLNDCWLAAYDSNDRKSESGLFFKSLTSSFRCNYSIFTNNVFSCLVPAAMRIDPQNGERRAIRIIDDFHLNNAIPPFSRKVFGRIIENMNKFEKLQRGIYIILMASGYSLEVQPALYCVALEAISDLSSDIIGKKEEKLIQDPELWEKVRNRFLDITHELFESGLLDVDEKDKIEKKINGMNSNFNAEKLKALLEYYKYPLTKFDYLTLSLRNPLLHGNVKLKKMKGDTADNLIELSLNLHKLCCSIALLMADYKGYIINNRNLCGFNNSGTAFIRI